MKVEYDAETDTLTITLPRLFSATLRLCAK
jgi:hypothetical protein